jgi:hypothetical protein
MHNEQPTFDDQAIILTRKFVKDQPSREIVELYSKIIKKSVVSEISLKDKRILRFGFNHPWLLPVLDAGLVLVRPRSELRYRIYIMFAILEATPKYSDKFLAKKHSPFYILYIFLVGIRAALRTFLGVLLIKALNT